jgi:hypothetical protein
VETLEAIPELEQEQVRAMRADLNPAPCYWVVLFSHDLQMGPAMEEHSRCLEWSVSLRQLRLEAKLEAPVVLYRSLAKWMEAEWFLVD